VKAIGRTGAAAYAVQFGGVTSRPWSAWMDVIRAVYWCELRRWNTALARRWTL